MSLNCNEPERLTNEQNQPLDMTRHDCSIGNPFSGQRSIQLRVELATRAQIIGNENDVSINFMVSGINESSTTVADNSALAALQIGARADITIDDG